MALRTQHICAVGTPAVSENDRGIPCHYSVQRGWVAFLMMLTPCPSQTWVDFLQIGLACIDFVAWGP